MNYTIKPDAPGHPDTSFKVFNDGIKVATLTKAQVVEALSEDASERIKAIHRQIDTIISDLEGGIGDDFDGQAALRTLNELSLKICTNKDI